VTTSVPDVCRRDPWGGVRGAGGEVPADDHFTMRDAKSGADPTGCDEDPITH
jgi:hypothetical protein